MFGARVFLALALVVGVVDAMVKIVDRPQTLYSSVSPKLRIQTEQPAFVDVFEKDVTLKFTPNVKDTVYNITIASDNVISLNLRRGKKWASPSTADGMTLYLTELNIKGVNVLAEPANLATVIPTPTIKRGEDTVIYASVTRNFVISGTNFREKDLSVVFDPPLKNDVDYYISLINSTAIRVIRATDAEWRSEPGPLKLKRINTGGGYLRIDPDYGGITVAEVQANLGAHGVTVDGTASQRLYQTSSVLNIVGEGFNSSSNVLRFSNSLRGKAVNYTTVQHTPLQLSLQLEPKSKWRANPANLPGPLVLLAVDAGAGFVPVGPTEAKKGRIVATIFEDPAVNDRRSRDIFQTHSHEIWITGTGFTRETYSTKLDFIPAIDLTNDVSMVVYNRTHIKLTLLQGRAWTADSLSAEGTPLRVMSIDTGAGVRSLGSGVVVGTLKPDSDDHPSGITVTRSTQSLYQTAALRNLVIEGSGFTQNTKLTFYPALVKDTDYTQRVESETKVVLTLGKRKKWRYEGGALLVKSINVGTSDGDIPVGSGGQGIQVANILQDPEIEESERIIFSSHTRRLVIRGSGFALEGTELTLTPTRRSAYEIESLEQTEIVLLLNEGERWAEVEPEKFVHVYVTKVDTGAGEVILDGDGAIVAKVESDVDDNNCDDSCEWALDGVCDDGTSKGRVWWDDDYGGFYDYEDDYYGYGYYYGDDEFLAPVCDQGTDCTDCGGPPTSEMRVDCDNSCQWANDGFCDDTRTSGLCDLGTDCHDCGPVSQSNFSSWDDDGWWDDDDNYWDIDDQFDGYASGGAGRGDHAPPPTGGAGAGGIFMTVLEGLVYIVGAVLCGGACYVGLKWYKGHGQLPYHLAPTSDPDVEMSGMGKSRVPITPDVHFT